ARIDDDAGAEAVIAVHPVRERVDEAPLRINIDDGGRRRRDRCGVAGRLGARSAMQIDELGPQHHDDERDGQPCYDALRGVSDYLTVRGHSAESTTVLRSVAKLFH